MFIYKATFKNDETGCTKSYKVEAPGIIPAVESACLKAFSDRHLVGYTLVKLEIVNK